MDLKQAIRASLKNIAAHGDTDIFPFPFETHVFFDRLDDCCTLLTNLHEDFDNYLASYPPFTLVTLTQVGYTGFRWSTQIEPFWNAYYLALVISLADQIEVKRIPEVEKTVFSYRYNWNDEHSKLFNDNSWRDYKLRSLELSRDADFVVLTDISDFYPRIYHHRIENALQRLPSPGDLPARIMRLLSSFAKNVSYGLPIGGPASRILAELALMPVDEHLFRRRISFCRYADDYSIFCKSKSDAYKALVLLSEKLFNEGLVLQKNKTRIMSAEEFRETSAFLDPRVNGTDSGRATEEQKLLNISIRFDPYSPTAEEDYERLKAAVNEVDIVGILGREVMKTAIDPTVAKQAINAIRALNPFARDGAIRTLLDSTNLDVLSPVFVTVMRAIRGVYEELKDDGKDLVDNALTKIYDSHSHLLSVDLNLSYFILALSMRASRRKEEILVELFDQQVSPLIRRQIILAMAKWKCFYWLTDIRQKYAGLGEWEKRAFILASYILGDEGKHWRQHTSHSWTPMDRLVRDWFSQRFQATGTVPI
jgi:hypothetical protein